MRRIAALALLLAAACSGAKGIAEAAITAADQAVAALPPDAAKVEPEQVRLLTQAVAGARDQLAKGDYEAALATVKNVPAQAQALAVSIPASKAAFSARMDTLAVAMPRNLAAIKTKLDALGKSKRLPKGIDAQQVQAAKDTYAAASAAWDSVMTSFRAGEMAGAMMKAMDLKARVTQSLMALGLTADERAWSNVTLPPKQ
ncbi:MAG: hypothetical protein DMD43_06520 [Gemmatimonadetes bacterium]|nr:MAG: hypothetical protein DMD43_06520 [Gemmatimonadota bacterium]